MAVVNVNDRITITTTNDYLEVGTADKIDIVGGKDITVGANDKLAVVPFQSATSIDYKIPQTVIDGLATVESLRGDLLNRLLALDVGLISAQQYIDNIYNNIREQVYTDLDVKYVSNTNIADIVNNAIISTDLSNLSIVTEYDTNGYPTVTTNLSEIKDRYIEVGDALSSFTSQLNANTTISSSALSQTNTLTARVEDTEAIINSNEYVAVGGFTEYTSGTPITGQWRNISNSYQQYRGNEWVSITNEQFNRYNVSSTIAGAKSLSTVGDAIVGWEYTNGGTGDNQFKIKADKFYLEAAGSSTTSSAYVPFAVDATTGSIVFNGNVTFGNNQTGTVNDAVTSIVTNIVSTVALGDKNINITDNLIPTTSFVADIDNSGYQLGGTCYKSMASGLDTFAEAQCTLVNGSSEMYSPYVDEMSLPYYYRFGIKGITSLSNFKIVTVNTSNVVTYGAITITLNPGVTLVATNWYEVDGIINPVGGTAGTSGSIRNSLGVKVGTVDNFIMPTGAAKLILGWTGSCVVSRMKLSKITAETLTGVVASTDFVENMTADLNENLSLDIAAAQDAADAANAAIADIASDNILSANEKPTIIADYSVILAEQAGIDAQATAYGITTAKTAYDDAITALTNYLLTLTTPTTWNVLTDNTTIVGTDFRLKFNNVYTAKQALLNAIDDKARVLANAAQTTADSKMAADELNTELARTTTVIDGGRITTGTIDASVVNVTNINASNIKTDNALVGHTLQSSDFSTIGGTGFRLKANAAGTSADPTIYGAYIKSPKFDGALSRVVSINESVSFPNSSSLTLLKTFQVPAPVAGTYRIHITASIAPTGGNYPLVYFDIRVNGVSPIGEKKTYAAGLGGGGIYTRSFVVDTAYTAAVTVTVYGRQVSNGFANPQTAADISISAIGVA